MKAAAEERRPKNSAKHFGIFQQALEQPFASWTAPAERQRRRRFSDNPRGSVFNTCPKSGVALRSPPQSKIRFGQFAALRSMVMALRKACSTSHCVQDSAIPGKGSAAYAPFIFCYALRTC